MTLPCHGHVLLHDSTRHMQSVQHAQERLCACSIECQLVVACNPAGCSPSATKPCARAALLEKRLEQALHDCLSRMRWTVHGIPRLPWDTEGIFDGVSTFRLDRSGRIYEHQVRLPVHLAVLPPSDMVFMCHLKRVHAQTPVCVHARYVPSLSLCTIAMP